uniref:Sodium voltage-gated channel beta subunit 2 n=1 Tax=Salmo trutta TaxID=8032 RepID=A0A673Y373_SALTR
MDSESAVLCSAKACLVTGYWCVMTAHEMNFPICDYDAMTPLSLYTCPASSMDVLVHNQINVLNGTMVRIQCIFTSCYKMDVNKFAMNWTYQENTNETEEMFMTYKKGMMPLRTDRFSDRVQFVGNLEKNDLSITLSDVQLSDEGVYNCYVRNPPDRIQGHGIINMFVVTECKGRGKGREQ